MSKTFSLTIIQDSNNKKKIIFQNRLKKLDFDKAFEDTMQNEVDVHDFDTAKIEIQQQSNDINRFTCELHQTLFEVLDFNPALKVINITLPYENDKNDIEFGAAEKKDRLKLLMTSHGKFLPQQRKK